MWATYPRLPDALAVVEAWGFAYKTVGFTWVKTNAKSEAAEDRAASTAVR